MYKATGSPSVSYPPTAEHRRLADSEARRADWKHWGPYVSERAWGTVREDYSAAGDAWTFFPHDHARSRAYRWNEDGLAGYATASRTSAWRSRSGMGTTPSSRRDSSA